MQIMTPSLIFPYLRSTYVLMKWFASLTVPLRFNNEAYLSCTTAVHQPLHFFTCPNTIFHIQGCTVFATYSTATAQCPVSIQTREGNCQLQEANEICPKDAENILLCFPANQECH